MNKQKAIVKIKELLKETNKPYCKDYMLKCNTITELIKQHQISYEDLEIDTSLTGRDKGAIDSWKIMRGKKLGK